MELTALHAGLAPSLGMVRGVTHAEYVRGEKDGRFYFLQIAARVGGGSLAEVVEAASGVNLWREWARVEVAHLRGEHYVPPDSYESHAGSVLCLAQTAAPEVESLKAAEIVSRFRKNRHAGVIVRSADAERVRVVVEELSGEFARRLAVEKTAAEGG
jgi:biotin carboxylase